ncbi:MAG: hypothetical protein J6S21_01615, partial [Victivallales bacterium]|nr:hypothetical protein [Victivallales bacterium]
MKHITTFLFLLALVAAGAVYAVEREIILQQDQEIPVYYINEAPAIDGELKESFWSGIPVTPMYFASKNPADADRSEAAHPAAVRLANDGKFLYISVDAKNPAAPGGTPGKHCWERDGFEVVFSTVPGKASSACQVVFLDRFGQLEIGSRNTSTKEFDKSAIQWKTTQRQGAWTTEVASPLAMIGLGAENDFYALFGRANCEQEEITASAPKTTSFHDWQATRRCRLMNAPVAVLLPATIPCDSRVFKKPLLFRNFSKAPVSGELRVCRTEKSFEKLADITFQPGEQTFDADFLIINHSLPFWLELRDKENRLIWRTAAYRYAGNSIKGIIGMLPDYYKQTGHPYFQELHQRLANPDEQMQVFKQEEKTLRRFLAPITSGNAALLKQPYYFYTASSMAKHASGEILPEKIQLPQTVALTAAQGETVNFQIRVLPLNKSVKGMTVKEFTIDGLPAAKLASYRILDIALPGEGIYPDPLSRKLTTDLTPEMNSAGYFFSATIPVGQKAGIYKGRVVLTDADGNLQQCGITVKVHSFALPEKPDMFVIFSYSTKRAAASKYF